jgi:hypothetical protein
MSVKVGQLRRWVSPYRINIGKVFLVIEEYEEAYELGPGFSSRSCEYIMDGKKEWHYTNVIERDSEIIDETR